MNQPTLYTSRLTLSSAVSEDLEPLHELWSEPGVRRFLFDDKDVPLDLARSILASALECTVSGYGLWLVHPREDRELLGCVGLLPARMAAECEPALAGLLEVLAAFRSTLESRMSHARLSLFPATASRYLMDLVRALTAEFRLRRRKRAILFVSDHLAQGSRLRRG